MEAVPVGLEVAGVDAYAGRRARLALAHEDVRGEVLVEGDQVVGEGREGDDASVRVQSRLAARRISFCAVGAHAGTGRRAAGAVVDEDVALPVRVTGDEIRGVRLVGDDVAVGADRRRGAARIGLGSPERDADPGRRVGDAVADEDVVGVVRVARDEVRRARREDDVPAVAADRRREALAVCLRAVLGHADPRRFARLPVVHEDVARAVRVAGDEVRGVRVDAT